MTFFKKNGWSLDDLGDSQNKFDIFCNMMEFLDKSQQDLILELTEQFLWIGLQNYTKELKNVFEKIEIENDPDIMDANMFHIAPMLDPEKSQKTGSSTMLAYMIIMIF